MSVTLLHTADVHRSTFDALRDRIAPQLKLNHIVRSDLLARAQGGIDQTLTEEITHLIRSSPGPVLCTCTTLGPVATEAGATRIDQPMMHRAATTPGDILMAYCLDSTLAPSLDLLEAELERAERPAKVHPLPLNALWPLFEAGQTEAFAIGIAAEIRDVAAALPELGSVVLAQASMAGATALLDDLSLPVLSSPELALRAMIDKS